MVAISVFIITFVLFIIIRNFRKTTTTNLTATLEKIPENFIEFPEYPGVLLEKPVLTTTKDYIRITMIYNDYIDETYLETLTSEGFKKASNVRYDKNNTYIIVEEIDDTTKIAFHIKLGESNAFSSNDSNNPISFS